MDGVATVLLAAFIAFIAGGVSGHNAGESSAAEKCDNFGAFMVDDVKYECRRVGK